MNNGEDFCKSESGLLTTIAATMPGRVQYALEGSIFVAGAAVQWLRDEMKFISEAADSSYFASKLEDNGGVYFVPAFTGLGAPEWDMYARGTILGLTRGSGRNHIIRAALESIAYQTKDVLDAMEADTGTPLKELRADGGASANPFLMQFQADIIGRPVYVPVIRETTALGAAYLAGLSTGFFSSLQSIKEYWSPSESFTPQMPSYIVQQNISGWKKAIEKSKNWA
jgi:Glycerol kinase